MHEPNAVVDADARIVVDACFRVHGALGPGYAESTYGAALALELRARALPFRREERFLVRYRNEIVGEHVLDFLVRDHLVVELKAVDRLAPIHHAQVLAYLRASANELGLLINFNAPVFREAVRRVVLTKTWKPWSMLLDGERPF